jgi:hypothetical protein
MIAMSTQVSDISREGALAAKKQKSVGIDFLQMDSDQFTPMPMGRGRNTQGRSRGPAASPRGSGFGDREATEGHILLSFRLNPLAAT